MNRLCGDVFLCIGEFLSLQDQIFFKNINKVVRTNYKIPLLKLNKRYSKKYVMNADFKERVLLSVFSENDIGLNLSGYNKLTNADVSALGNVGHLNVSGCEKITDVSALGNVGHLNVSNCYNITDVSALRNVKNLNVSHCYKITDISALKKVTHLKLIGCTNIN